MTIPRVTGVIFNGFASATMSAWRRAHCEAAVSEQGAFQRLGARDKFLSGRPKQVLVITNANRQPDGVVSDFKRVCCRRDQWDVASSNDEAREARRSGGPTGPQSSSEGPAELEGTRWAGTRQAKA